MGSLAFLWPAVLPLWADPLPLHVSDNQIVTSQGCTIRLRGVNMSGLEYQNTSPDPHGATGTQSEAITAFYSNIVRLPLNEDRWFGCGPGQSDGGANYRSIVDSVVAQADSTGTYVDLDLHWAGTATGASSPCGGAGWGTASNSRSGQQPMPDDNAVTFWSSVASRYANNPAVLFDLFNEPFINSWSIWQSGGACNWSLVSSGGVTTTGTFHSPGMQVLLNTVRSAGASNICVAGGLQFAYDLRGVAGYATADPTVYALSDPGGNGVVYATHIYSSKGTSSNWDSHATTITSSYPVILEEYGESSSDPVTWDSYLLGWADGGNSAGYVYSAIAWDLSSQACPCLLSNWSGGYSLTSTHGAPVSTWMVGMSATGTCPTWTPTPTATFTPCGYPGATCTPTFTPTPTATPLPPGPVKAQPNILTGGQNLCTFKVPEPGATLWVYLYTLAGELAAATDGGSGGSLCAWDSAGVASGLYLARVKVTDADGSEREQTLKILVLH